MSIAILTSKVGFGTYIPAVYIYKQYNCNAYLYCIEDLLNLEEKCKFETKLKLINVNPLIAEKCSYLPDKTIDESKIENLKELFQFWAINKIEKFVCFSGKWDWILNSYSKINPDISVTCVIIDSCPSIIWKKMEETSKFNMRFIYTIKNDSIILLDSYTGYDYTRRLNTITCHGGGWGLLTESNILKLKDIGFPTIRLLVPENKESQLDGFEIHKFHCDFCGNFPFEFRTREFTAMHRHPSLDLIGESKCFVTKPGGMSIIDAIMSETPLILDSITIGMHEENNRKWILSHKIGIEIENFTKENVKNGILDYLYHNIIQLKTKSTLLINELKHAI